MTWRLCGLPFSNAGSRGGNGIQLSQSCRELQVYRGMVRVGVFQRLWRVLLFVLWHQSAFCADAIAMRRGVERIDLVDLKRHVMTLSSDSLEGREAGSRGGKAASAYLRSELRKLRQINSIPNETTQEFGRDYQNLLLLLPGIDARLKQETIIIGAHYDHVGYGNSSNSRGPFGQIHNGADDNASGTAVVMELIDAFSSLETPPARSILFAFWDAEEAGLLGSKHWVGHPTVPMKDIRFVLNLDMLGRLREGRVITSGWRSAPGLRPILSACNPTGELKLLFQARVIPDSDHYHFYASGIPSIHLDTDKHDDYHRPTDDPDRLNWDGLESMAQFSFRVVQEIANRPELPQFRRDALKEQPPNWLTSKPAIAAPVRFGVSWDAEKAKKNIVQITQVNPDSPAARAGIRVGDRIVRLGNWENGTYEDLRTAVQTAINPVAIRVQRPGIEVPVELEATFSGSPIRLGAGWIEDSALPGCLPVVHVIVDSPADRAGLKAGDVLLEMGGLPLGNSDDFVKRVTNEAGPLQIVFERNGYIRTIEVDLLDHPKEVSE